MTPEQYAQQQAFERRLSMFATEAWKEFVEEIDQFLDTVDKIHGVKTIEELFLRKGKASICMWIKNLPAITDDAYELLKEEDNAA